MLIVDEVTKPQTITSLSDLKNKWGYDMPVVSKAANELAKGGEITMQPLVPGAPMMGSGVSEQDAIVLKEYLIKTVGV